MSTPVEELVNVFEAEAMAKERLSPERFGLIAGSERRAFERMTFRPRMMVNTKNLDLSLDLFGQRHFAPILAGPAAMQQRFHAEGELATVRGAVAAKAGMVLAEQTSVGLDRVAPLMTTPFWYQLDPGEAGAMRAQAQRAIGLGAKAIVLVPPLEWATIDQVRRGLTTPVLLKGVMTAGEARAAVERGLGGVVVSGYRAGQDAMAASLEALPAVAGAVAGKIPVLMDGSIRRGSDVLKALALGARAVLVARPVLWGLSAYGEAGVRQVLEMLQTELARDIAMCGVASLAEIRPEGTARR